MDKLTNYEFRTATKVVTDIHAGGNFFWTTYYDKLKFENDNSLSLIRVYEKNNAIELSKEELLFKGDYNKPKVGYYEVEITLKNINNTGVLKYCGKIIDNETLICHGYMKFNESSQYESELFMRIR